MGSRGIGRIAVAVALALAAALGPALGGCATAEPAGPDAGPIGAGAPDADPIGAGAPDAEVWPKRPVRAWPVADVEVQRDGTRDTTVLWPLYRRTAGPELVSRRVFPFYWSLDDPRNAYTVLFPLLWLLQDKQAATRTHAAVPLFYRRLGPQSDAGTLLGLYWWRDAPERRARVLAPLYWSFDDPDRSLTALAPLLWVAHEKKTDERTELLLPLWYRRRAPGLETGALLPVYWWTETEHARSRTIFPLWWWAEDERAGRRRVALWPLYGRSEDPGGVSENVLSWLVRWSASKSDPGARTFDAGVPYLLGLYGQETWGGPDGGFEARALAPFGLPLAGAGRRPGASHAHLFPVFFWRERGDRRHLVVLPLFGHGESPEETWGMAVPPLVHWRRSKTAPGDGMERAGIPFVLDLYRREAAGDRRVGRALTLFPDLIEDPIDLSPIRFAREGETFSGRVAPIYWQKEGPGGGYLHLFPLYRSSREGARAERSVLWPLVRWSSDPEAGEEEIDAPFPLVAWRRDREREHFRALPLAWFTTARGADGTPDEDLGVLFPIYWRYRRGDREYVHVLPFYGVHRDGDRAVRRFFLGPVVSRARFEEPSGTRFRTDILWPFGMVERTTWGERHIRALPLLWHDRAAGLERTVAFPLYWNFEEDETETTLVAPPLYAARRGRDGVRRQIFGGPLYVRTRGGGRGVERDDVLFPLGARVRHEDGRTHWRALPVFWRDEDPARDLARTIVFPLFWHSREGDTEKLLTLPLYGHEVRGDEYVRRGIAGPLYLYTREGAGPEATVRHDALFWLAGTSAGGGRRHARLLPLFWHDRHADGREVDVVAPLFWRFARPGAETLVAFPLYGHDTEGEGYDRRWALFPLYMRTREGPAGPAATVSHDLLWPLAAWASGPDRRHLRLLPLFWHHRDPGLATDGVLPLYVDVRKGDARWLHVLPFYALHRKGEDRSTELFGGPLYVRTIDGETRGHHVLWPLFARRSGPEGAHDRAFPLYWSWSRPDGDLSRVVFPLWWQFRRGPEESRVLFPLYFARSKPEEEAAVAPLVFFRRDSREAPIRYRDWRRLLAPVSVLSGAGERHVSVLGAGVNVTTKKPAAAGAAGEYDVRVLHKLVQVSNVDGLEVRAFRPLFSYEAKKAAGYKDVSVLGPLFRYTRRGAKSEVRLLHFIRL